MPDPLTPSQRHYCMSRIHSRGTKPELKVRRWLWSHGYRYRLNVKSVPGKPDIVLRKYRTAIFVNGCFWHGHGVRFNAAQAEGSMLTDGRSLLSLESSNCCKFPQTNREFWVEKIRRNQERDRRNYQTLLENGWQVLVVWECQLNPKLLENTMCQVELLLNEKFLAVHRSRSVPVEYDWEETALPIAAEPMGAETFAAEPMEAKTFTAEP